MIAPRQLMFAAASLACWLAVAGAAGPTTRDDVGALLGALVDPAAGALTPEDTRARQVLHQLALQTSGAERVDFVKALAAELEKERPVGVKVYVLDQLKWAGTEDAVGAVGRCLQQRELLSHAAMALTAIGGDASRTALRDALSRVAGGDRHIVIQALGVLRDGQSATALRTLATDNDREVRLAAFFALANIGDEPAATLLFDAMKSAGAYECAKAADACLLLARRLAESGRKDAAVAVYRRLADQPEGAQSDHVRAAGVQGLVSLTGAGAMGELLKALASTRPALRAAARETACAMVGEAASKAWVAELGGKSLATEMVLAILGRRADPSTWPPVSQRLKDPSEAVRLAAIAAAPSVGGRDAVVMLVELLGKPSSAEAKAARQSLIDAQIADLDALLAQAVGAAADDARVALIEILAARRAVGQAQTVAAQTSAKSAPVRLAAITALGAVGDERHVPLAIQLLADAATEEEAKAAEQTLGSLCVGSVQQASDVERIGAALGSPAQKHRMALCRVLGRVGGPQAMSLVREILSKADGADRDALVRIVASWPDVSAMADLLRIAGQTSDVAHHVLAMRRYLGLAAGLSRRAPDQALKHFQDAAPVVRSTEGKKAFLGGVGDLQRPAAIKLLEPYAQDEEVKDEAAAASLRLARSVGRQSRPEMAALLRKIIEAGPKGDLKTQAQAALADIEKGK